MVDVNRIASVGRYGKDIESCVLESAPGEVHF